MSIPVGWFLALVFGVAAVVLLGQYLLQKIQIAELLGERDDADAATKHERERRISEVDRALEHAARADRRATRAEDALRENRQLMAELSKELRATEAALGREVARRPAAKKAAAPRKTAARSPQPKAVRKTGASS